MTKRQANILLAILGTIVVVGVLLVAGGAWLAMSVLHRQDADQASASAAFEAARAPFKGTTPVFELRSSGPQLTRPVPPTDAGTRLRTIHFLIWERDEQRLTQADVPLALLRWKDSPIDVMGFVDARGGSYPTPHRVSIRLSELERFGPSLLLDQQIEDGSQVLVWTE